ncbi:uncharacterized protein LOC128855012 [Anastrepha ludens]|uniref:uncharacterized protein LOC128855012 n=1 Tax=Anastrepha ludens TaxID=28586 RepID=UPI0023AE8BB9|nr:uncharacterized protein LOC128855012 [Anastrepha ludens]
MSYKDAACSTKLGIIPPDYPTTVWSTERLTAIQHAILEAIRKKQTGAAKPKFNSCTFRPGYIVISCGCDDTANWLKEVVPKLKPWKDAQLKIVQEADIPRPQIFVGHFPELDSPSTEDIISLLDGQNEGLNTNDWRVLNRVRKGTVVEITIAIDPISAEVIKTSNNWLNYGFGKTQLRPKSKGPIDPPKVTEQDPDPSAKQSSEEAGTLTPTASIAQDDKASCPRHEPKKPTTSGTWRHNVAEGIRMRPPLQADKKAHSHKKDRRGDQMSAEEAVLLKSNRGKKKSAIAKRRITR